MENNGESCCLTELLSLQLAEVDLLSSMYPSTDEFQVDDPSVLADMRTFIAGQTVALPPRLDYTLHLALNGTTQDKLEVSCSLPHDYPASEPELYARSASFTRNQQHQLNQDLSCFIANLPHGELHVGSAIQWLQDHAEDYLTHHTEEMSSSTTQIDCKDEDPLFARLWIYSHHIYNKCKRRSILELAHQVHLTGFCMPGKPGIICAEGPAKDADMFWQRVKHMNWKKIMLKKTESQELKGMEIESLRKFGSFDEICFQSRRGPGREYHMDMGEFFQFLEKHHCGHVFKDYFGVDGRIGGHM